MKRTVQALVSVLIVLSVYVHPACGWYDETHIMIGKAAGYAKWFNATGADMVKIKAHRKEAHNHYVNNPEGTTVTPEMVLEQVSRYDQPDLDGHLYGAIIAAVRNYITDKKGGKYGEYHLGFCLHYVGDLSQPLHNTAYNDFNKRYRRIFNGIVNDEILDRVDRIELYPIKICSEEDLAKEIARIANLSIKLGYQVQREDRLLTKEEAYEQLGHSASLFRGIMDYVKAQIADQ